MTNKFKVGDKVRLKKDQPCSLPKHIFDPDKVYTVIKCFTTYYGDCIDVMGVETGGWYSWRFELVESAKDDKMTQFPTSVKTIPKTKYNTHPTIQMRYAIITPKSGNIVGYAYCEDMAQAIITGMGAYPNKFQDGYHYEEISYDL